MTKPKDEPTYAGAYIITHKATGVEYVGSAEDLYDRQRKHMNQLNRKAHPNKSFQEAYNSDPEIHFNFFITIDRESAFDLEQSFLNRKDVKMFNVATDARKSALGRKVTEEHKEILRKVRTGKKASDETKQRQSDIQKKRAADPEVRERLRQQAIQAFVNNPAARERMRQVQLGRKHTPEQKAKRLKSAAHLHRPLSINGVEYPNIAEASRTLGIAEMTIRNRCRSDSLAFKEWKLVERKNKEK